MHSLAFVSLFSLSRLVSVRSFVRSKETLEIDALLFYFEREREKREKKTESLSLSRRCERARGVLSVVFLSLFFSLCFFFPSSVSSSLCRLKILSLFPYITTGTYYESISLDWTKVKAHQWAKKQPWEREEVKEDQEEVHPIPKKKRDPSREKHFLASQKKKKENKTLNKWCVRYLFFFFSSNWQKNNGLHGRKKNSNLTRAHLHNTRTHTH